MSDTVQTLTEKLHVAMAIEDHNEIIKICTQILSLSDANNKRKTTAYILRGVAYDSIGEYGRAIQDFDKAIELEPNDAETYCNRGNAYTNKGEYDRAIQDYDKVIELEPKHVEAHAHRGAAYGNKGEHDRAIQDFDKAIELDPSDAEVYCIRGIAYEHKGEYNRAVQNYDKAIELDPYDKKAYYNRGNAYAHKGKYDRAIQDYDKAIELDPNYAEAYHSRGVAYEHKGEYDHAIQDQSKSIELKSDYAEAYYGRGIAYSHKGEHDRAIQDYDKAIEIKPNYAGAYYNRGIEYADKDEYDHAIQDYDKAIEIKSDYVEAYNNRGIAYGCKGEYDRAIQDYDKAIELNSKHIEAYYNRGIAYRRKGEYGRAIQDYDKAIELEPDYSEAIHNRAIAMASEHAEKIQQQISDEHKKELKEQIKKQQEKFNQELKSQIGELIDYYRKREQDCKEKLEGNNKENSGDRLAIKLSIRFLYLMAFLFFVAGLFMFIFRTLSCRPSCTGFICSYATCDDLALYVALPFILSAFSMFLIFLWKIIKAKSGGLKEQFTRGVALFFLVAFVLYSSIVFLYIEKLPPDTHDPYGLLPFILVGTLMLSPFIWVLRVIRQEIKEESILREDAHTNYVLSVHMNNSRFNAPKIHEDLLKQFFDHHDKRGSAQLIASLYRPTDKSNDSVVQNIMGYATKAEKQVKSPPTE